MMTVRSTKEHVAFLTGRQGALRTTSELVDQFMDQLIAAREELQEARAEYAARIAQTRAHFDAEVAAMRRELAEALAELGRAQLLCSFARLTRGETDRLN
jgi:hypothetical protein